MKSLRDSILEHLSMSKGGPETASKNISKATKDFSSSNAPQFRGKSQKKRHQMAVAAGLNAARGESATPKAGETAIYEGKEVKVQSLSETGMAVIKFANRKDAMIVRGSDLKSVEKTELNEAFMMAPVGPTWREPSNYGFAKIDLDPEDIGLFSLREDEDTGEPDDQEEPHDNGSNVRHDGHTGETEVDNLPKPSDTISPAYSDKKPPKEVGSPLSTETGAQEEHLWDAPDWDGYDYPADAPEIPTAEFDGDDNGNSRAPHFNDGEHQPGDGQEDRDDGESFNDDDDESVNESDHWIQGTHVDEKGHKGNLHRALGVPQGEKIPSGKLNAARHSSNAHTRKMANMAHNMNENEVTDPARDEGEEHRELNQMRKDLDFVNERAPYDDEGEDQKKKKAPKFNRKQARAEKEKERTGWMDESAVNERAPYDDEDADRDPKKDKTTKFNRKQARSEKEKKRMAWMDESAFMTEMDDLLGPGEDTEPNEDATITFSLAAMASVLVTVCHQQPDEIMLKSMIEAFAEVSKGKTIEMSDLDAVAAHMNGEETQEIENREEGKPDHEGIEDGSHSGHESWPGDMEKSKSGKNQLMDCGDPMEESARYFGGDDVMNWNRPMTEDEEIKLLRDRAFPNKVRR